MPGLDEDVLHGRIDKNWYVDFLNHNAEYKAAIERFLKTNTSLKPGEALEKLHTAWAVTYKIAPETAVIAFPHVVEAWKGFEKAAAEAFDVLDKILEGAKDEHGHRPFWGNLQPLRNALRVSVLPAIRERLQTLKPAPTNDLETRMHEALALARGLVAAEAEAKKHYDALLPAYTEAKKHYDALQAQANEAKKHCEALTPQLQEAKTKYEMAEGKAALAKLQFNAMEKGVAKG